MSCLSRYGVNFAKVISIAAANAGVRPDRSESRENDGRLGQPTSPRLRGYRGCSAFGIQTDGTVPRFLILGASLCSPQVLLRVLSGSEKRTIKESRSTGPPCLHKRKPPLVRGALGGLGPWEGPTLAVPPDSSHSPERWAGKVRLAVRPLPLSLTALSRSPCKFRRHLKTVTIDTRRTQLGTMLPQISCLTVWRARQRVSTSKPALTAVEKPAKRLHSQGSTRPRMRFRLALPYTLQSSHHITRSSCW